MAQSPYANQQSGIWNQYGGSIGVPTDLRGLYGDPGKAQVETRLDWKELNKFSLYTPILRVIGDSARKCGAEARFVQDRNFPWCDEIGEIWIELRRAGETTLLDFNTLVQMIEEQGTLAVDFSGVRRIVEVTCALLPNPKPQTAEEGVNQALYTAAEVQQQMAMAQQQAAQYQHLAILQRALGMSQLPSAKQPPPVKQEEEWGIDRIKAFLGLKP
jgi:hypothetical protein